MNEQKEQQNPELKDLEYTLHARRSMEKTIRDPYFRDNDPEMMLEALLGEIRAVSFGDYLKRYIRRKREKESPEAALDAEGDLDYLCDAFRKNNVPPSLTPTTAKLRPLAKNWLAQRSVSRSVVLLLGFALEMTPDEVNEFLTKALRESRINPKDPFEVICWYCYRYHLPFSRQEELWNGIRSGSLQKDRESLLQLDQTVRIRRNMESIATNAQLTAYISQLSLVDRTGRQSRSAREQFDVLYRQACALAAGMKTDIEREEADTRAVRMEDRLSRNDKYYDFQKNELIRREQGAYHTYAPEEITPADLENMLYSAVPKDRNGNLIPMKKSLLNIQFYGKRLNRQHLTEILEGKGAINRFDLITLSFFVMTGETDRYESARKRYDAFVTRTNQVLRDSDMEPLYVTNPYESFLLMCMLADDPLGSFSDVWELSYESE